MIGAVSHWCFEGDFKDSVGTSDGVAGNGAAIVQDNLRGQVAYFDGVNDYLEIPSTRTWTADSFTALFWVKIATQSLYRRLLYIDDQWSLNYTDSGGKLCYNIEPFDVDGRSTTQEILGTNSWKHVAFVYSAVSQRGAFYFDGAALTDTTHDSPAAMGWDNTGGVDGYLFVMNRNRGTSVTNGAIDDLVLFTRALSAVEIKQIYSAQKR